MSTTPSPAFPSGTDIQTSVIRTVVPIAAGLIVTWLGHFGFTIENTTVVSILPGLIAAVWYTAFRYLEAHVNKAFGWFLGNAKAPIYTIPPAAVQEVVQDVESGVGKILTNEVDKLPKP